MKDMKLLTIILFLLILFTNPINSQINYGIKISGGISELYGEDVEQAKEYAGTVYNIIPSFQTGMFINDTIFNHFFWKGELLFSRYGCKSFFYEVFSRRGENYMPEERHVSHLYYFNIPLMLQSNLLFPDWLIINFGINNGIFLNKLSNNPVFFKNKINTFDIKFTGGFGVHLNKLFIDIEYINSLNPINEPFKHISKFDVYNRAIYFSVGYYLSK